MAARALSGAPAAALALLAVLALSPTRPAASAEEPKVWRALTDGESRGARPAPANPSTAARGAKGETFPSQFALALIVAAVIATIVAVGAHQTWRRPKPPAAPPRPEPEPEPEPAAGSHVEELWRTHLQRRRPHRDDPV